MAILTFKYLRELQKSERDSPILQKIDNGFYKACANCLKNDSTEAESAHPLIKSIFDMRERKIVTAAIQSARGGTNPENLLSEEQGLFLNVAETIKSHRNIIETASHARTLENEQENKISEKNPECLNDENIPSKIEVIKIRAISEIPSFVAEDRKSYGPVAAGDSIELPKKAAEVLINAKVAEKFED